MGGFSSRRGCCCCRRIVRFLFLLRRLLRLLLLVRVGRHESGTGPPRSWFASFFFLLSVRQFRLKEPSGPARGSLFTVQKTTDCLASSPSSERLLLSASSVTSVSFEEQSSQSANYDFLPGSLSRRVPCRPRFLFLSLSFLRRSSRHPLYAAAPLPPPPPLSRATGREERDGTSERGERNGREGREDRGRAAGGAPA